LKLKFFDYAILIFVVAFTVAASLHIYGRKRGAEYITIKSGSESYIYPIDKNISVDISGPLGITKVVIENGSAFIADSPCANKLCIKQGKITRGNSSVTCLPNLVSVIITGSAEVDGATF
jgi:hypothetical protein